MDPKLPYLLFSLHGDNSRVCALGDNDRPLPLAVLLGQIGHMARNLGDILCAERMCVGISPGLGLVADDEIPIGCRLIELVLEELRDEGRAEAQDEDGVLGRGLLSQRQHGGDAHGQMVAADEIY